LKPLAAVE
jgi:hypothetical protein